MSKKVLAIDPGDTQSAMVVWNGEKIEFMCKEDNDLMLKEIDNYSISRSHVLSDDINFCVEKITSYGMAVGQTTFDTCVWAGRFLQRYEDFQDRKGLEIFRREVKLHHCGQVHAKDSNIIRALIDRFEPNGKHGKYGKGTKKDPGLFYGFSSDIWQAFALAVYYYDVYINFNQ